MLEQQITPLQALILRKIAEGGYVLVTEELVSAASPEDELDLNAFCAAHDLTWERPEDEYILFKKASPRG